LQYAIAFALQQGHVARRGDSATGPDRIFPTSSLWDVGPDHKQGTPKMAAKKKTESVEITVLDIDVDRMPVYIIGRSPLIFNAVADKARRELLLPWGRKTAADRAGSLKHEPLLEYRNSTYRYRDNDRPTRLFFKPEAFKKAMATAALDLPGTKRTEIGRLCWVEGIKIDVYGIPMMKMDVVRSADVARTPDIRTRAILPEWVVAIDINFVRPKLREPTVHKLLMAAGITVGVGDFRQEKGAGSFGQFKLTTPDDPDFQRIMKTGGRVAQDSALHEPQYWDTETEELYTWFTEELERRGRDSAKKKVEATTIEGGSKRRQKKTETVEA
jgi:hypothetical protein